MKKVICCWLILTILTFPSGAFSLEESAPASQGEVASAVFKERAELYNIQTASITPSGKADVVERQGRTGWLLRIGGGVYSHRLDIDLSDSFAYEVMDGTSYTVEVDYFDDSKSPVTVVCDAIDNSAKECDAIYGLNDRQWKTAVFELDDAYFGGRLEGADLRIAVRTDRTAASSASVLVSGVRVIRHQKAHPLQVRSITTESLGNVFANGEEQNIQFEFSNYSENAAHAKIIYRARDGKDRVVWSLEDSVDLAPGETVKREVHADVTTYGILKMEAAISAGNSSHVKSVPFCLVNNITDGTANDRCGYCVQFIWDGYDPYEGAVLLKKSGVGYVRSSLPWSEIDTANTPPYSFKLPPRHEAILDALSSAGISYQVLLAYGNAKYDGKGGNRIPADEKTIQAFSEYTRFLVKELEQKKVDIHSFEIWNEPNIPQFNAGGATSEEFGYFTARIAKTIRELEPEASIGVMAVTAMQSMNTQTFVKEALAEGAYQYADAITLHPYSHTSLPEEALQDEIQGLKNIYEDYAGKVPKVYFTESGYSVNSSTLATTSLLQAKLNVRNYIEYTAQGLTDGYCYYALTNAGGNLANMEFNFGHLKSSVPGVEELRYAPKESFPAIANMNKRLQNTNAVQTISSGERKYAYLFRREKDHQLVMPVWASEGREMLSFRCGADKLTVYDLYGNRSIIHGQNGVYSLILTDSVQYIEGDLNQLELVEHPIQISDIDTKAPAGTNFSFLMRGEGLKQLQVQVESLDSELEILESDSAVSEKGRVLIRLPDELERESEVVVQVTDGEHTCFEYQLLFQTVEPMAARIETIPLSETDVTHWKCSLYLTNQSQSEPISGQIVINAPAAFAETIGPIKVETIPAQSTGRISFVSGRISKLGIYPLQYTLLTDNGKRYEFTSKIDFSSACYVARAPVIDGRFSKNEWDWRTAMYSDSSEQVYNSVGYQWTGISDLSAKTVIQYDYENFYMAVDVVDDIHCAPETKSNAWKNDGVQFGVTLSQGFHDLVVGGSFTQITIADSPEGPVVWRDMAQDNAMPCIAVESAELIVKREGSHTYYELSIPWDELIAGECDFKQLERIGFSMLVNDNDGAGRKGFIEYASGIGQTKDTSLFTFLNLFQKRWK